MPASRARTPQAGTPFPLLSHTESPPLFRSQLFHIPAHNHGHSSQTPACRMWTIALVTPDTLTRTVQDYLSEASGAVVLENGAVAFDLGQSKYSISGEYNKCLLHLWSAERNTVRRVLDAEVKNGTLRLAVQRLGQARPTKLEICRERDRRTPSARRVARASYEQKLRRTLDRHFSGFAVTRLTSGVDLEKSFGPNLRARRAAKRPVCVCGFGRERERDAGVG